MSTRSLDESNKEKESKKKQNHDHEDDDDDEDDEDYVPDEKVKDSEEEEEPNNLDDEDDKLSEDENSPSKSKKPKLGEKTELNSKRTDELWSNFLNDVKSSPTSNNKQVEDTTNSKIKNDTQLKPKTSPATLSKPSLVKGGGLTSILSKINKQPKISTLEKSRLDWEEFKKSENLEDDLNRHSKGKESYLEKRAFLERTDYREYEIEKNLRTKERKIRETH